MSGVGGEEECRFLSVVLLVDIGVSDGDEESTYRQEPIVGSNDQGRDCFLIGYSCKITGKREGKRERQGGTRAKRRVSEMEEKVTGRENVCRGAGDREEWEGWERKKQGKGA